YTVQIIGARNTSNLARFARRNGLGDELAYYTLERKGEALYLLVNGVYESAEAAAEARSAMPADVQVGKPWIRTLADIQSSIRESRAIRRVVLIDQPPTTTQ
ncbi:MAG: SPOR domain-containing protein, partial [Gammaproteobacteria bacterium]